MQCLICLSEVSKTHFSQHLRKIHNLAQEDYALQHYYGNTAPLCKCGCGQKTSYIKGSYKYNDFIHNHHKPTLGKEMLQATKDKISLKQKEFQDTLNVEQKKENTQKARKAAIESNIKKYGVSSVFELPQFQIENAKKSKLKIEQIKDKLRLTKEEILEKCNKRGYQPLFQYEDYKNHKQTLLFKCVKHNIEFELQLRALNRLDHDWCYQCRDYGSSKEEKQLVDYIKSIYNKTIIEKKRNVIKPYELDVYLPENQIAFEYNGLHWHCDKYRESDYHFIKYQKCKDLNIQLIQFFSDEWLQKKEICKSIIKSKLGLLSNISARKLKVNHNPGKNEVVDFLNKNHLYGACKYFKAISLEDDNKNIKMVITFRKPFTKNKNATIEIARVATELNIVISGGFSRLMKHSTEWAKQSNYVKILTYSDCRFSFGQVYEKYGFIYSGHTSVGYHYTDNYIRFNRFKFRAKDGLTEKEVAEKNKVYKIYDAGHYKWILNI